MFHNAKYSLKIGKIGHSIFILHPSLHGKLQHSACHNVFLRRQTKLFKLLDANFKGAENKKIRVLESALHSRGADKRWSVSIHSLSSLDTGIFNFSDFKQAMQRVPLHEVLLLEMEFFV